MASVVVETSSLYHGCTTQVVSQTLPIGKTKNTSDGSYDTRMGNLMAAPKKTETLLNQLGDITDQLTTRDAELSLSDRARILSCVTALQYLAKHRPATKRGKMWR